MPDEVRGTCKTAFAFFVHDRPTPANPICWNAGPLDELQEQATGKPLRRNQTEIGMVDSSGLLRRANELRNWAEHEADETIRGQLMSMADHYEHLAESQNWSKAHSPDVAALGELLTKRK